MSEITIKRENVQKAYDEGCDDVKATLQRLFPDVIKKVKIREDITRDIYLEICEGCPPKMGIKLNYDGYSIGYVQIGGIIMHSGFEIDSGDLLAHWRVYKNGDV